MLLPPPPFPTLLSSPIYLSFYPPAPLTFPSALFRIATVEVFALAAPCLLRRAINSLRSTYFGSTVRDFNELAV